MPMPRVRDFVVSGVLRLLDKGIPMAVVCRHFGVCRMTGYRIVQGQHPSQTEKPVLGRCVGCGAKVAGDCHNCLQLARLQAQRLLARRLPIDAIELKLLADHPALDRDQVAELVNSLLLVPLLPRNGETRSQGHA